MKAEFTAYAYAAMEYSSISEYASGKRLPMLCIDKPGSGNYYEKQGYAQIGTATITLEIHSTDKIALNQIESLKIQLQTVRAEAQTKENAILLQISKLQALTLDASQ